MTYKERRKNKYSRVKIVYRKNLKKHKKERGKRKFERKKEETNVNNVRRDGSNKS